MLNICKEDGTAVKFPIVCPHCDQTYWHEPGGVIEVQDECRKAIFAQRRAGARDEGTKFWMSILSNGIRQGRSKSGQPV